MNFVTREWKENEKCDNNENALPKNRRFYFSTESHFHGIVIKTIESKFLELVCADQTEI